MDDLVDRFRDRLLAQRLGRVCIPEAPAHHSSLGPPPARRPSHCLTMAERTSRGATMPATKHLGPNSLGALARFGLLALVPVVALGAILGHELNVDLQRRYLETAQSSGILITQVAVRPLLDPQEVSGGLTAVQIAEVDDKLQGAAVHQDVRRLKVWNRSGTVVYSDNHAIIGRTFEIEDVLAGAFGGHPHAGVPDGHAPENSGDDLQGPLIEVYVPLVFDGNSSPSGAFELYLPYAPVQAAIDSESKQLYIILAAGLTLFYASMFPVVLLADRWRRRLVKEAETTALANLAVLERLNTMKSEFLTRVSHQFRTARVGIQGFSELIRDSEDLDLEKVRAFAGDIYEDAERLDRAFGDMLELDRMEGGRSVLHIGPVDINQLIVSVVEGARTQSPRSNLVAQLNPALPQVRGDPGKLSQVLPVLVGNAIKYSPLGSNVTVTTDVEGDPLTVAVKDHGPGMPADIDGGLLAGYLPHPDGDHNGVEGGTGLGLPIAPDRPDARRADLVRQHSRPWIHLSF